MRIGFVGLHSMNTSHVDNCNLEKCSKGEARVSEGVTIKGAMTLFLENTFQQMAQNNPKMEGIDLFPSLRCPKGVDIPFHLRSFCAKSRANATR